MKEESHEESEKLEKILQSWFGKKIYKPDKLCLFYIKVTLLYKSDIKIILIFKVIFPFFCYLITI